MESSVLIYCSEVAALVGEHPYKKRWEAVQAFFKRWQQGRVYLQAVERCQQLGHVLSSEEVRLQTALQLSRDTVDHFLATPVTTAEELQQSIESLDVHLQAQEQQLKAEKQALQATLDRLQQQQVEDCRHPTDTTAGDTEIRALAQDLQRQHLRYAEFQWAKQHVISQKQTTFGRQKEEDLLQTQRLGVIVANNATFYKKWLGQTPCRWGLGGKIDGFREGELVEIKNRKSKFYDPLPRYDLIQVQCYLQVVGVPRATLIQCLATGPHTYETRETVIERDDRDWNETLWPELEVVVAALYTLVHDTLWQDRFLQAPDAKKSYVVQSLLTHTRQTSRTRPQTGPVESAEICFF